MKEVGVMHPGPYCCEGLRLEAGNAYIRKHVVIEKHLSNFWHPCEAHEGDQPTALTW